MSDKYLHVSCLVKQEHLYELLHSLEVHKIGNVEVRAVSRILNGAAEVVPKGPGRGHYPRKRRVKNVLQHVREFMQVDAKHNYNKLAQIINANPKSVANAMRHLMEQGVVKKLSPGIYVRVKEDKE